MNSDTYNYDYDYNTAVDAADPRSDTNDSDRAIAGEGGGGSSIGMGMMSIVTGIQERALTLTEELRKIKEIDEVLVDLSATRDRERSINSRRRKHLLERVQERNEVELEIFDVQDTINRHRVQGDVFDQERMESVGRIETMLKKRTEETMSFYGPNLARMELYAKTLEDAVLTKERLANQRQQRLRTIRNELEQAERDEDTIRTETDMIRVDMRRRRGGGGTVEDDKEDNNGDDSITHKKNFDNNSNHSKHKNRQDDSEAIGVLSKKIRETIEQRSNLRKKLRDTQRVHDEVNEVMLKWEEKHVEMTIN